jgi:hypothetical protein
MDMFLRLILILLLVFWVVPLVRRSFSRRPPGPGAGVEPTRDRDDRLTDLTRQDISDADFEDLPPEE